MTSDVRRVYVFKCQECGKEFRISEEDRHLINEEIIDGVHCSTFECNGSYCYEDRMELVDAEGNVSMVIV